MPYFDLICAVGAKIWGLEDYLFESHLTDLWKNVLLPGNIDVVKLLWLRAAEAQITFCFHFPGSTFELFSHFKLSASIFW